MFHPEYVQHYGTKGAFFTSTGCIGFGYRVDGVVVEYTPHHGQYVPVTDIAEFREETKKLENQKTAQNPESTGTVIGVSIGGRYPSRSGSLYRETDILPTVRVEDGILLVRIDDGRNSERWEEIAFPLHMVQQLIEDSLTQPA